MNDLTQPIPLLSVQDVTVMGLNTINKLEEYVKNTIVNGVKQTINTLINTLRAVIERMNQLTNEDTVDDFKIAVRQLSIFCMIFLSAMEGPLLKSTDIFTNSAIKFIEGLTTGSLQVLVSVSGAIPFYGAIIDTGRAINNATEIVLNGSQAVKTSVNAFKQVMNETKNNINNMTNMANMPNMPNMANMVNMSNNLYPEIGVSNAINKKFTETANGISQRTNNTINQFQAPVFKKV
jgi:hypothetical protein